MRARRAKTNQAPDPVTREHRFAALMAQHKEDLVRSLMLADPIDAEEAVKALQDECARLTAEIEPLHRELAEAKRQIAHLTAVREVQRRRHHRLLQDLNAAKEGK